MHLFIDIYICHVELRLNRSTNLGS